MNYAYYEPPGAQALHNNPLLVRSHDFAGDTVSGLKTLWQAPELFGQGTPAGGGAHLVGSFADLPYARWPSRGGLYLSHQRTGVGLEMKSRLNS